MNERVLAHIFRMILGSGLGALLVAATKRIYPRDLDDWVVVNHVKLELPRLLQSFHGFRLAQISDFHIGTWLTAERLEEAVEIVNAQQPDLVAITGDFVTFEPEKFLPGLVRALRQLSARHGAVAVLGNHDHWTDPALVRQALRQAGVRDLSNEVLSLQRENECLHIAGVDCHMDGLDELDLVLSKLPAGGGAILLAHEPDFADQSAASGRFDLQISGHSHGGQVLLPVVGTPFLPSHGRKYVRGLHQVGEMLEYTNCGLGTAELQIRFRCPAEITMFELASPEKKAE